MPSLMESIEGADVNYCYRKGLALISEHGERVASRNGPVLRVPFPVTTTYTHPTRRVLFSAQRDANPFFHCIEALWIIAGMNDVDTLTQFVSTIDTYSDNGTTFHGAYGYRLRHAHGELDQLSMAVRMLTDDPSSRRVVTSMWFPQRDLDVQSRDIPCNLLIKWDRNPDTAGALNATVVCRSNDAVFGAYGANVVQFSTLLEYMAARIGCPIGYYRQVSLDFHAYESTPYEFSKYYPLQPLFGDNPYVYPHLAYSSSDVPCVMPCPLVDDARTFDDELQIVMHAISTRAFAHPEWLERLTHEFKNTYFRRVVWPLYRAHDVLQKVQNKDARYTLARAALDEASVPSDTLTIDWLAAADAWLARRERKEAQAKFDNDSRTRGAL